MPGLKVFGRRWEISSDDFVFPEIIEGIVRIMWTIVVSIVYSTVQPSPSCQFVHTLGPRKRLHAFVVTCLIANSLDALLAFVISWISAQGTIRDPRPRRHIRKVIYARIPLAVFELIWLIVGTAWIAEAISAGGWSPWRHVTYAFSPLFTSTADAGVNTSTQEPPKCFDPVVPTSLVTVVLGWALFFGYLIGLWMVFDPMGNVQGTEYTHRVKMTTRAADMWKRRFRVACCCWIGRDDNASSAYEDVAGLLSAFFVGTDLVMSDIWAGLLLLANREFRVLQDALYSPARTGLAAVEANALADGPLGGVGNTPPPGWMNLRLAGRFFEFAKAIYGWPNYLLDNLSCGGLCGLCRAMKCSPIRPCQLGSAAPIVIQQDNCCLCHTGAFRLATKLPEADLFYLSYHNRVYEVPFAAVIDHQTQSIVIAIRGSMSMQDAITDLCANEETIKVPVPSGSLAGAGAPRTGEEPGNSRGAKRSRNVCDKLGKDEGVNLGNGVKQKFNGENKLKNTTAVGGNLVTPEGWVDCERPDNAGKDSLTTDWEVIADSGMDQDSTPRIVVNDNSNSRNDSYSKAGSTPTASKNDAKTSSPEEITELEVDVHRGILTSAQWLFNKLETERILFDLFILYPNYHLILTGHSLGGGVAAVLAMLLRSQYPSVRCFAFSPPGGVVSESAIVYTQSFIMSVVVGDDMVPRLSMQSFAALKRDLLASLETCDRPKYEILVKGCFKLVFNQPNPGNPITRLAANIDLESGAAAVGRTVAQAAANLNGINGDGATVSIDGEFSDGSTVDGLPVTTDSRYCMGANNMGFRDEESEVVLCTDDQIIVSTSSAMSKPVEIRSLRKGQTGAGSSNGSNRSTASLQPSSTSAGSVGTFQSAQSETSPVSSSVGSTITSPSVSSKFSAKRNDYKRLHDQSEIDYDGISGSSSAVDNKPRKKGANDSSPLIDDPQSVTSYQSFQNETPTPRSENDAPVTRECQSSNVQSSHNCATIIGDGINGTCSSGHSADIDNDGDPDTANAVPLYCPGRIIHLQRHRSVYNRYRMSWKPATAFRSFVLSAGMVRDHMPFAMSTTLKAVNEGMIWDDRDDEDGETLTDYFRQYSARD